MEITANRAGWGWLFWNGVASGIAQNFVKKKKIHVIMTIHGLQGAYEQLVQPVHANRIQSCLGLIISSKTVTDMVQIKKTHIAYAQVLRSHP